MRFVINNIARSSSDGTYPPKPTYGWGSVVLQEDHTVDEQPVSSSSSSERPVSPCPVICAVDANGRFFVRNDQEYVVKRFAEPFHDPRTKDEKLIERRSRYAARCTSAKKQTGSGGKGGRAGIAPAASTAGKSSYPRFLGAFLRTFVNVSARDANAEWHRMGTTGRAGRSTQELVSRVAESGAYELAEERVQRQRS